MMRILLFTLLFVSQAHSALVQVPLCLTVNTDETKYANLVKLVRDELGRHPTHRLVKQACRSNLIADLYEIQQLLTTTMRIDQQIPVRYTIKALTDLPLHPTRDRSSMLLGEEGEWTPTIQLGLGVGF